MQSRRDHHQTPSVESGLTLTMHLPLPLPLSPLSTFSLPSFPFLLLFWLLSFSLIFLLPPRVVVTCPPSAVSIAALLQVCPALPQ